MAASDVKDKTLRNEIESVLDETEEEQPVDLELLRKGKYSNVFILLAEKYSYFRKFMPDVFESIGFTPEAEKAETLLKAVNILKELNSKKKRKLPRSTPTSFLSASLKTIIYTSAGKIDRRTWETSLYYKIRDEVKNGNINAEHSKRYCSISNFYIVDKKWKRIQSEFYKKSKLPEDPKKVKSYLDARLNTAYDNYFSLASENTFARIVNDKWKLSVESDTLLSPDDEVKLKAFSIWIEQRMRVIKLPELLLEVNNDLNFLEPFIIPSDSKEKVSTQKVVVNH
jgi:hypothetical protein